MITKNFLVALSVVTALFFVGCADNDDDNRVPTGETVDKLTVEKGQSYKIDGTVKELTVKEGANVIVGTKGKVGTITVPPVATTGTTTPAKANIVIEGSPASVTGKITNTGKANIAWTASSAAELTQVLAKERDINTELRFGGNISIPTIASETANAALAIGEEGDIGYEASANDNYVIDGQNHTLDAVANKNVVLVTANNVTIKNLTVTQPASVLTLTDGAKGAANGITFWRAKGGKLENVTVKNCAHAGVISAASEVTATKLITEKNVWGGVNVSYNSSKNQGEDIKPTFAFDKTSTFAENFQIYSDYNTLPEGVTMDAGVTVTTPAGVEWEKADVIPKDKTAAKAVRAWFPKGQAPKDTTPYVPAL